MAKGKQKQTKKDDNAPPKPELTRERSTPELALNSVMSEETQQWVRQNWKTLLLVFACTALVFVMKIHEESNYGGKDTSHENLYEILGLDASSSLKDIKRQYNKLAVELHPDKHPNCTTCPEKFQKVSHAYEILSDEEKKLHYDQTEGILETIKSASKPIYAHNYQKLVLESPYLWILQIYLESGGSQHFAGFWEEYVEEYDYLKFGRIHAFTQRALLPRLPFALDEIPFVFSMSQQVASEVLEYNYDESPNTKFHQFVRKAVSTHHYPADGAWVAKALAHRPSQKAVLMVGVDHFPVIYSYLALRMKDAVNFYASPKEKKQEVASKLEANATLAVFNEDSLPGVPAVRQFKVGYSKAAFKGLASYLMFTSLPRELTRRPALLLPALLHRRADLPDPPEVA